MPSIARPHARTHVPLPRFIALLLLMGLLQWPPALRASECVPLGQWTLGDGTLNRLSSAELMNRIARYRVVLLGEDHDNTQHHAWQLHVLAALHTRQPEMMIGFESFPRRVQPVLDRWVSGQLSEAQFLKDVDWEHIWGIDSQLYLPVFHFARMHRIPMLALNVDRTLVQQVGQNGWHAVLASERQGVGDPSPATQAYLQALYPSFQAHRTDASKGEPAAGLDDPRFRNFADSMLLWDRAMAEAIAGPLLSKRAALVVGIAGRGHLEHRHGIPRQLESLGMGDVAVLLPWDERCELPPKGIADAVFGMDATAMRADTPRLGVELGVSNGRVRIQQVVANSIAAQAGLLAGDILENAAGTLISSMQAVISIVKRQAPGTWLPIVVSREGQRVELVAKFPPKP